VESIDRERFQHVVWCDLEIILLKIYAHSAWNTKMVSICDQPDLTKPFVNVYICEENDSIFDRPSTYREKVMYQGLYRGHHFGRPARLKYLDEYNVAIYHQDPGKIIWCYVIKFFLTLHAMKNELLHIKGGAVAYKGKSFLFLGRGGSGKTETINRLCKNGASFMGNTHLLVKNQGVFGIKSNIRVREDGADVYVPISHLHNDNICDEWLPIGGLFWVKYRTDGKTTIKEMPADYAFTNLQWFAESIGNWELKEDMADYCMHDPFVFAHRMNHVNELLKRLCADTPIFYLNTDILSDAGLSKTISLMDQVATLPTRTKPDDGVEIAWRES
jgi:hypothetical protein